MWRKIPLRYWPTLVVHKQRIFTSNVNQRRAGKRENPYASVLKDDMLNLTPEEVQQEISFMADMPMGGVLARQEGAEMDIKSKMKLRKIKNIERKYFKREPETCFLTWDMKEQLKGLHSMDPHVWTPTNLSYVFPASEPEIKILLKTRRRLNEKKIKEHDMEVLENWKKHAKGQFGSVTLLKKTIEKRLSEVNKTTLPAVTMGNNQEVASFLENLKFTDEDDKPVHHNKARERHLEKIYRHRYPFKESFKEIITKYNEDLKELENSQDSLTGKELVPKKSLSEILPVYKEDPDVAYVKVQSDLGNERLVSSQNDKTSKNVAYDDFIKFKAASNSEIHEVPDLLEAGELRKALSIFKKLSISESRLPPNVTEILIQKLSESGDICGMETIGNLLSDKIRKKLDFSTKFLFAYRKNNATKDFLNRVHNHVVGHCEDPLVDYIPHSVIYSIAKEEPYLGSLLRECAEEAAKNGHLDLIAALMNSYVVLKKKEEVDEIYSKYFATAENVPIVLACKLGYRYNDYTILDSILQLINRNPEGRDGAKFLIYSTLLDLLIKENRIEEALGVLEDVSSQNMQRGHLRKTTVEKLKKEILLRGISFTDTCDSVKGGEGAPADRPTPSP